MKFSEKWLRTFVDPPLSATELANALTMAGLEVEAIEAVAPAFDKVVVGEVLSAQKHPDADHLSVCRVNTGLATNAEPLQIVCGAPDTRAGIKVPCALPGAQLPGITIRQTTIRGVESAGMLCSAQELGLQGDSQGLLLLPPDAPAGVDFRDYYELDDKLFTLKLTPNRGDCLGLTGVAREVAAITGENLYPLAIEPVASQIGDALPISVEAPDACPLYCGRVIRNVTLDVPTPPWMVRRLERSGIRAINVVVDVTNYVMLETGQPLHAFDLAKISDGLGGKGSIHVRYAKHGEQIQLLNGEDLVLQPDMLVITDEVQPLALAGIMGGIESGVEPHTKDVFLESAFFSPTVIAGKSFTLGFSSDSAHRFERGVDFAATRDAMERASRLILDICGGRAGPVSEIRGELPRRDPICLRLERTRRILGIDLGETGIAEILQRLQFNFRSADGVFHVTPPTYRFDLAIEEDLIEELARVHGYNRIPANLPAAGLGMLPDPETARAPSQLRQILAGRDYQEVINYGFVDVSWESELAGNRTPVMLKNPLSSQMSAMRSSLLGGLISNLRFNLNHKQPRVRLFEIGYCFTKAREKDRDVYLQEEKLAGLCYGDIVAEQWDAPAREVDFYDVKADIEALFWPASIRAEPAPHPALHPGKSARIRLGEKVAGHMGELHPRWQKNFDLPKSVVLFELDLGILMARTLPRAAEISKYPPIRRDIAVVVAENIEVQMMLDCMQAEKSSIVSEISLFDVYRGKGVEHSKKSLAFRILLQDTQKTLTDAEADREVARLLNILEKRFDATLRN
ncbi:phenylalanine--tRNA ligase subunit beta [Nitrosovibrio tenuis]|uniref:Phenylalanine--tRNA ligase beta subunit n=1 Tax=Nitrosovibrio tenuis TaxID=1233 RepID=A0A1H7N359_9PROT|nr:phenylalanine--tRNA ligase subunit beta [Nitrosovibrio tenuis]SEL18076.1 phenylalanyl-tRNA synthetase beta subunit [Nitrosovibrio tenuis]